MVAQDWSVLNEGDHFRVRHRHLIETQLYNNCIARKVNIKNKYLIIWLGVVYGSWKVTTLHVTGVSHARAHAYVTQRIIASPKIISVSTTNLPEYCNV
jgi:hypothetical protein